MKNFKLVKSSSSTKTLSRFSVISGNTVYGSINVAPDEEAELLACWKTAAPAVTGKQLSAERSNSNAKVVKSLLSGPRLDRKAVLRGC